MRITNGTRKRYSTAQLNARLRFIIGCTIAGVYAVSILAILYALVYVSQPMQQSPNDAEFYKILGPGISFTTGILSGMMMAGGRSRDTDGDGVPDDEQKD